MTDAERLISCVRGCGFDVVLNGDGPSLRRRRPDAVLTDVLLAELKAHRAAVIEHLRANPPGDDCEDSRCDECGKLVCVWGGDRDTAFLACQASGTGTVACPFWRPPLAPEWWGKARWFLEQRRREAAAKANEDIPE